MMGARPGGRGGGARGALEKSLGAAIRAQGDASKDRDHAIEKRLDDLRGAPAAHHPAPPAIVAEA